MKTKLLNDADVERQTVWWRSGVTDIRRNTVPEVLVAQYQGRLGDFSFMFDNHAPFFSFLKVR